MSNVTPYQLSHPHPSNIYNYNNNNVIIGLYQQFHHQTNQHTG